MIFIRSVKPSTLSAKNLSNLIKHEDTKLSSVVVYCLKLRVGHCFRLVLAYLICTFNSRQITRKKRLHFLKVSNLRWYPVSPLWPHRQNYFPGFIPFRFKSFLKWKRSILNNLMFCQLYFLWHYVTRWRFMIIFCKLVCTNRFGWISSYM